MPLNPVGEHHGTSRRLMAGRGGVATYDFRRPTKLSRDSIRLLQVTFETFARRLTTLLTSGLRQVCHVSPTDISQQSYDEYVTGRQAPTLMVQVAMPQLPGTAVLEFSLPVALAAVDHMLGGPGGDQQVRPLTDIETSLIDGLLDQILGVLQYSFEPLVSVRPTRGAIEYNPQFVQIVGASDAVLVALFDMTIGSQKCELSLCFPLAPLLPRLARNDTDALGAAADDETASLRERLSERFGDMPIDVSVEFVPTRLSTTDILSLAVDDVIPLTHRVGTPLAVRVGDVTYATAVAGRSGKQLAALISETPQEQS